MEDLARTLESSPRKGSMEDFQKPVPNPPICAKFSSAVLGKSRAIVGHKSGPSMSRVWVQSSKSSFKGLQVCECAQYSAV